ncbi:unnamed protein product [Amoebophrya sp. A25]|nr:unnamed protein product [Amoebophrya sp. A25]|eukprot:GSA25T00015052001.1
MARRTKKVGITGRFGTRYGSTLRKLVKRIEVTQRAKYLCPHCGKTAVKRKAAGIWGCKPCSRTYAGGCWQFATAAAASVTATIQNLKAK